MQMRTGADHDVVFADHTDAVARNREAPLLMRSVRPRHKE
jgi:hypothetical protein